MFPNPCLLFVLFLKKMKSALLLASIAASASAFVPVAQPVSKSAVGATKADLEAIAEKANPIIKFYDPLNLAGE
jgi:hypothetical protein